MAFTYSFGPGIALDPVSRTTAVSATGYVTASAESTEALTVQVGGVETTSIQSGTDGFVQRFVAEVPRLFLHFPGLTPYEVFSYGGVVEAVNAAQAAAESAEQAAWDAVSSGGGGGAVASVNGQTGEVVLDAGDVGALPDTTSLFSGRYSDLSGKPTIPSTPGQVGEATEAQGDLAESAVQEVVAGTNVFIDNSDPARPVVSASGGSGGGGDVLSVNGQIGNVTLDAADVGAQPAGSYVVPDDLDGYATAADLSAKADAEHTHQIGDVTRLQSALDGKQPAGNYATAVQGAKADSAVQPSAIASMVTGEGITSIVSLTQAAYDAIDPKDPATLYVVVG